MRRLLIVIALAGSVALPTAAASPDEPIPGFCGSVTEPGFCMPDVPMYSAEVDEDGTIYLCDQDDTCTPLASLVEQQPGGPPPDPPSSAGTQREIPLVCELTCQPIGDANGLRESAGHLIFGLPSRWP